MAADIAEAVIDWLSARCGDSFGESLPTAPKFFTDWAPRPDFPYAVVTEIGEGNTFTTESDVGSPTICEGAIQVTVVGAGNKQQVRQLADLINEALFDPELQIDRCNLMYMRPAGRGQFTPIPTNAPDQPTVFATVFTVPYMLQRN